MIYESLKSKPDVYNSISNWLSPKNISNMQSICHKKNNPTHSKMISKTESKHYCYLKSHNSTLVLNIISIETCFFYLLP